MEPLLAASPGIAVLPERSAVLRPANAHRPSHRLTRPAACAVVADGAMWSALLGTPTLGSAELAALAAIALARQGAAGARVLRRRRAGRTPGGLGRGGGGLG